MDNLIHIIGFPPRVMAVLSVAAIALFCAVYLIIKTWDEE